MYLCGFNLFIIFCQFVTGLLVMWAFHMFTSKYVSSLMPPRPLQAAQLRLTELDFSDDEPLVDSLYFFFYLNFLETRVPVPLYGTSHHSNSPSKKDLLCSVHTFAIYSPKPSVSRSNWIASNKKRRDSRKINCPFNRDSDDSVKLLCDL